MSYTINPFWFQTGMNKKNLDPSFRPNAVMLIAKQNMANNLTFVDLKNIVLHGRSLTPDITLADFGFQNEVEVKVEEENVVKVIPAQEFYKIMRMIKTINDKNDYQRTINFIHGFEKCDSIFMISSH